MKKIILIMMSVLIGLGACATAPKPSANTQASVVTFNCSSNNLSALTFWRKINADGSKGKCFSVGGASKAALLMNGGFKKPFAENITLDAGTYYLDSFQVSVNSGFIVSQGKHYAFRNGWDDANNKPMYLSFTVQEGSDLQLPEIEIVPLRSENGYEIVELKLNGGDASTFVFGSLVQQNKEAIK